MYKFTITLMLLCLTIFSGFSQEGIFKNRNGVVIGKSNEHIPGTIYEQFTLPNNHPGYVETDKNQQEKSTTSVLLEEYFDEWPPVDWSIYLLGNAGTWMLDVGEGAALHTWEDGSNKNWLITPQLYIDSDNYKLSLRNWANGLTDESCHIAISTGSGNPDDGDFVDVLIPANTGFYYDLELFLFQYEGENIYIGFHTTNLAIWRIDDVIVAPNSFVDGSLERIVNPSGNAEVGAIEPVQIKVKNNGTSVIEAFDINWSVNGVDQGVFSVDNANISPDGIMIVEVGEYDFSAEGLYTIDAELILDGDANLDNNTTIGEYSVGFAYDLVLKEISPNGSFPNSGNRNIYFTVINNGEDVIDQANASLIVNETEVLNVDLTGLNIQPGSISQIFIGEYSFSEGVNEITGQINVDFDLNNINNQLDEHYTVGAIYEAFQQPEFPPVAWKTTWAELDWWFPQFNDSTNTYVQMHIGL